ncbi:zinc finger protein 106 [Aplysia californica]|uniref:Zinc finger protein 106 n=1 Tax=Aplysia californica TaxID=6500 RepID=A0ABM0ZW36_APLCA|nr:zinc finger protein 106 [Aplysia californica]XP_005094415.1 zinc finger protein 106 [Aplysia californica]XP_012935743.1 zinc finger protein 106 [Aplysia californica]
MSRSKSKLKRQPVCSTTLTNTTTDAQHLKVNKKKKKKKRQQEKATSGTSQITKMSRGSSSVSSSSLSSKSSQGAQNFGSANSVKKAQCDLCKLSYTSQKELTEHLVSLMHHTKLEDKEENAVHKCELCGVTCPTMSVYRAHISGDKHQKNLAFHRGEHKNLASQRGRGRDKKSNWNPPQWKKNKNARVCGFGYKDVEDEMSDNYYPWNGEPRNKWGYSQGWNNKGQGTPFHLRGQGRPESGLLQYGNQRFYGNKTWHAAGHAPDVDRFGRGSAGGQGQGLLGPAWGSGAKLDHNWNLTSSGPNQPFNFPFYQRKDSNGSKDAANREADSNINFTTDQYEGHWDEQSLLMQENFLAGMEQDGGSNDDGSYFTETDSRTHSTGSGWKEVSNSQGYAPSRPQQSSLGPRFQAEKPYRSRWDQTEKPEKPAHVNGHHQVSQWDRKRPRNEEDVQESLPKASRSLESDSNDYTPVRDTSSKSNPPVKNIQTLVTQRNESAPKARDKPTSSPRLRLTEASDNILERAERLCVELRKKREAAQAQRSSAVKHHNEELLSQKMSALIRKQQSYVKGHIQEGQKVREENDDSGVSSASTLPSKQSHHSTLSEHSSKLSSSSSSKGPVNNYSRAKGNTLDDIMKSIEKNVLEEKQASNSKAKAGVVRRGSAESPSARGSVESPSARLSDSRESSGFSASRSSSVNLTKDNLKNMVNAPRSRNERVQLAKILQSREEPRAALRTSLQLEGLYDNVDMESVSVNLDKDGRATNIKLEDLSQHVRDQILTLIGGDLGIGANSSLSLSGISQNIINISDDEETNDSSHNGRNFKPGGKPNVKNKALLDKTNVKKKKKKRDKVPDTTVDDESLGSHDVVSLGNEVDSLSSSTGASRPTPGYARFRSVSESNGPVRAEREIEVHTSFPSSTNIELQRKNSSGVGRSPLVEKNRKSTNYLASSPDLSKTSSDTTSRTLGDMSSQHDRYQTSNGVVSSIHTKMSPNSLQRTPSQTSLTIDTVKQKFPTILDFPRTERVPISNMPEISSPSVVTLPTNSIPYSTNTHVGSSPSSTELSASGPVSRSKSPAPLTTLRSSSPSLLSPSANPRGSRVSECGPVSQSKSPPPFRSSSPSLTSPMATNATISRGSGLPSLPLSLSSLGSIGCETAEVAARSTPVPSELLAEGEATGRTDNEVEVQPDAMSVSESVHSDPSAAMAELLLLSEREEHVKQEMTNMELRLTRLHRLLEQAVTQINKCTERRNQLLEEEQDLSKKRLTLLRDATSSKQSMRSSVSDLHNSSLLSEVSQQDSQGPQSSRSTTTSVITAPTTSVVSTSTATTQGSTQVAPGSASSDEPYIPGTALSKADWLAKFSSYLPPDMVSGSQSKKTQEKDSSSLSKQTFRSPLTSPRVSISEPQVEDVVMADRSDRDQEKTAGTGVAVGASVPSSCATPSNVVPQSSFCHLAEPAVAVSLPSSTPLMAGLPVMYVGSFKNPNVMRLSSVSALCRSLSEPPQGGEKDVNPSDPHTESSQEPSRERHNTAPHPSVVLPPRSSAAIVVGDTSPRAEDSDIGSIASSIASGSSLGEQISRYCRSTPGASADAQHHHDLSVILSAPSDTNTSEVRGYDSNIEVEEADAVSSVYVPREEWEQVVRPCSVIIEKLELQEEAGIYGNLDKAAVRSAEALHLMERNFEGSSYQSSLASDGKKKIRKTRQERDNSGLRRWRRHWVFSSSSSDGEGAKEATGNELDIKAVTSRVRRSGQASSGNNSADSSDVQGGLTTVSGGMADADKEVPQNAAQAKTVIASGVWTNSNITVAECDSSTNHELVDSESINLRTNTLREMRESFEKTFGRSPRTSPVTVSNIISTTSDVSGSVADEASQRHIRSLRGKLREDQSEMKATGGLSREEGTITVSDEEVSMFSKGEHIRSSHSKGKDHSVSNLSRPLSASTPSLAEKGSLSVPLEEGDSVLPGNFGSVFDIQVMNRLLFVGHRNHGVRVYDALGPLQSKTFLYKYNYPDVQCMCIAKLGEEDVAVLGMNGQMVILDQSDSWAKTARIFLLDGVVVKCFLLVSSLLYIGTNTGEISVFDTVAMKEQERFVCSDRPIHCMAPAQEGFTKLLCVAAQDGAIIVVDTHNLLPLRILVGHSKTAFSIQVHGHLVYSGSGDSTVLAQNLHTATLDHFYKDNKGIVNSVWYSQGHLFTGGMDKLVRCYNAETRKLVQVYFGADRGVITKLLVHDNMLITGTSSGSVDMMELDLTAEHKCHKSGCGLNFGSRRHLFWHLLNDHGISKA